jgi:toxin ParE1/3/4
MNNYSLSEAAVKDLNEICEFIAKTNKVAASNLFDKIRKKCKLVANFPNMGKNYDRLAPNLKGFVVDDYLIFYYPRNNGIDIVHVVNGYRDLDSIFFDN